MDINSKQQVIFFDLGDTLIYFGGDWNDILRRSIRRLWKSLIKAGYSLDPDQFSQDFSYRMRNYYIERNKNLVEHTSARVLMEYLIDSGYSNPDDSIIRNALSAMYSVSQECWNVEPDAILTLEWLKSKGYKIGLISNASDKEDVYTLLNQFNLIDFFEHIIISAEFGLRKPHKDIFQEGLTLFSANPENCFMVGDRLDMDILGAKKIGITSIWISRRSVHKGKEHLFDIVPDFEIQSLDLLMEILGSE